MEDKFILQKHLDSLFAWGKTWGLSFNVSKCNILHLARQVAKPVRFYTLGSEVISSVSWGQILRCHSVKQLRYSNISVEGPYPRYHL